MISGVGAIMVNVGYYHNNYMWVTIMINFGDV